MKINKLLIYYYEKLKETFLFKLDNWRLSKAPIILRARVGLYCRIHKCVHNF